MSKKSKVSFTLPPLGPQHAKAAVAKGQAELANPVTRDQVTQQVTEMIQQSGIQPQKFVEIGQLAEDAINDKKKYSKFVNYMVREQMEDAKDLKKPDYQMLASLVVIGRVARDLPPQPEFDDPQVQQPVAPQEGM
jgi:hypothetical protein